MAEDEHETTAEHHLQDSQPITCTRTPAKVECMEKLPPLSSWTPDSGIDLMDYLFFPAESDNHVCS